MLACAIFLFLLPSQVVYFYITKHTDKRLPKKERDTQSITNDFHSITRTSCKITGIPPPRQKDLALCKKCDIKNPLTRHNFFMSSSANDNKEDAPEPYELITRLLGFPDFCLVVIETVEHSVLLTLER